MSSLSIGSVALSTSQIHGKAKKIIISIAVVGFVLIVAIIIISIFIAYIRRQVDTVHLNISVTEYALWRPTPSTLCDPYDYQGNMYRLNFYSGPAAYAHVVAVYRLGTDVDGTTTYEFFARIVVPQETIPSSQVFSVLLNKQATYLLENSANGTVLGQLLFTFPNPCPSSPPTLM
jgi:hypothetical protein